jgi:lysophospholipase L1-like esterase
MNPQAPNRGRTLRWGLARVGLVLFGLLATVVALEVGLQAAAFFVRSTTDRPEAVAWSAGSVRVLCLGDSNTFGLHLEREQAYPPRLQELWNASSAPPELDVVNFGYPGTSSSRLLSNLDSILETFVPSVVVLMVGVNDYWTGPTDVTDRPVPLWKRYSRLYRLYLIVRAAPKGSPVEPLEDPDRVLGSHRDRLRVGEREFDVRQEPADPGRLASRSPLPTNLRLLVDRSRERGVEVHLMTYPARTRLYEMANPVIRKFARESNTPLVDLEAVFGKRCSSAECPEFLFGDNHPNAAGAELIAETVRDHLSSRLRR